MKDNKWLRLLTYVTGLVNQELLLQNEYLAAENRILRAHLPARLRLSDPERSKLAEIGKRLGRKALAHVACVAKPDTILAWYRRLIASKFDGSKYRSYTGRPRIGPAMEALIVQMARENSGWGYDRIVGALANLGHRVSDQTVGNVLRRHGIEPAPKRSQKTTWREFIQSHMAVLAGIDFFTVEVLTWRGLVTYYVLFFIHLESRRVSLAGITRHPDEAWMLQMARNATDETWGASGAQALRAARSGHEVLRIVSGDSRIRWNQADSVAGAQSESERLRGKMGPLGQAGVPVETDPVRRSRAATCAGRVRGALSRGTESPGQGQRSAVSLQRC